MPLERIRKFLANNGGFIIAYITFSLVYILSLQYVPATLTIEMKASESDIGQLFNNTGTGYRETESLYFPIDDSGDFKSYHLQLPGAKITSIRIDPLTQEGTFAVRSVTIKAMNYHIKLDGELLRDALAPLNQVELDYKDGLVHGISTGIDPHFGLDGKWIVNRLPFYISPIILVVFLILLLFAKKLFPGSQYELSFALFLVLFALPTVLPRIFSLALALIAVLMFLYLLLKSDNLQSGVLLHDTAALPNRARLENKRLFYSGCLFVILLLAFFLRISNLTILDPYTDEYSHLLAAKEYLETGVLSYTRASLVTYLVAFFYRTGGALSFYEYLFWGRVPGVIFSSLTVIPLYFLTRKISQPVALIAAFLWATSPWAIGVARTIREYAFYPFFILLVVLVLIKLLELLFEFKMRYFPKIIICLIPVIILVGYALRFDTASTLRICMVIFAGIAAYYFVLNYNKIRELAKTNKAILLIIIAAVGLIAVSMLVYANKSGHVSFSELKLSDYWLRIFLVPGNPGAPMHWWGNYHFIAVVVFILGVGFFYAAFKRRFHYFMHFSVFTLLLIFYVLFFDRYIRPRYIIYALPFFIPLVAVSIYALLDYAKKIKPLSMKIIVFLAVAVFLFQAFNFQNMLYPVFSDEHGYVKTTDEHHDSLKSTIQLLEKDVGPDDVLITTIFRSVLILSLEIENERIFDYDYKKESRFERVEKIIEENPQGFMVLDWRRNGHFAKGYPKEGQFMIGETTVEVIQNKDGMQVYRWER